METSRRTFLASSSAMVLGANDRIRVGVIGTGGRGKYLMKELQKLGGVEFVAVSDVWDQRRDEAEKLAGAPLKKYLDHRDVLNHKDIDAVIVATPTTGMPRWPWTRARRAKTSTSRSRWCTGPRRGRRS